MPYEHIENIGERGSEKVASFITLGNLAGVLFVAGPLFAATVDYPFVPRVAIVLLGAVLGFACTVEVRGMAFYERVAWRVRGAARRWASGARVRPEDLPGVPHAAAAVSVLSEDSPIAPLAASARPARRIPPRLERTAGRDRAAAA